MRWKHVFHPDFAATPYWWDDAPQRGPSPGEIPKAVDVLVVGSGYAGLNAALELTRNGREPCVVDAHELGHGASSCNAGAVSGGTVFGPTSGAIGELSRTSRAANSEFDELSSESAKAFDFVEAVLAREAIDCHYERSGHFVGAYARKHLDSLRAQAQRLNTACDAHARIVDRDQQWKTIGSDFYRGGMLVERAGKLHPALYQQGLLDACSRRGVTLCAHTPVLSISGREGAWSVGTNGARTRANDVILATNGYSPPLHPSLGKSLVPMASHMVATESITPELARVLVPRGRTLSETSRLAHQCRLSPDGSRILFGGRAPLTAVGSEVSGPVLYTQLLQRFPQLRGIRLTHAWSANVAFTRDFVPHAGKVDGLYYCVGGNGNGISMLSYLGHIVARELTSNSTTSAFWGRGLEAIPVPRYRGKPWFLPLVGGYLKAKDWADRRKSERSSDR